MKLSILMMYLNESPRSKEGFSEGQISFRYRAEVDVQSLQDRVNEGVACGGIHDPILYT